MQLQHAFVMCIYVCVCIVCAYIHVHVGACAYISVCVYMCSERLMFLYILMCTVTIKCGHYLLIGP